MPKQNVEEFVLELLKGAGCKGILKHKDSITSQCPFHFNKSNFKTFRVSTKEVRHRETGVKNYYFNCFSCHRGGTIPSLVAHIYKCSFKKALKIFEKKTLINKITIDKLKNELAELSDNKENNLSEIKLPPSSKRQEPMYEYLLKRKKIYHKVLNVDFIVNKYGLYYCSTGRMTGRIIMPVRDIDGTVIGYNDRTINDRLKTKSLHPKSVPYGLMLHGLYENRGKQCGIVAEGSFDMFAVDSVLIKHKKLRDKYGVVNLMGTAFTSDRLNLLLTSFDELCLMFDHDKAGVTLKKQIINEYEEDILMHDCTESYPEFKDPGKCTEKEIVRAIIEPFIKKKRSYLEYIINDTGMNFDVNTL